LWLAVPLAFGSAVLGLTGLFGLLVGATGDIALSSALFGASVAIGLVGSGGVAWTAPWQRVWLRWGYLAGLMVVGVLVDGLRVPVVGALCVGLPSLGVLIARFLVERRRPPSTTSPTSYFCP
jgi:hypothetical protein